MQKKTGTKTETEREKKNLKLQKEVYRLPVYGHCAPSPPSPPRSSSFSLDDSDDSVDPSRLSCTSDLEVRRTSDGSRRGASGIVVSPFFNFEGGRRTGKCRIVDDTEALARRDDDDDDDGDDDDPCLFGTTGKPVGIERHLLASRPHE